MKNNRPLWEPKRRIEAAFRRRLLAIARIIVREIKSTADPDEVQQILLGLTRTKEYQKLCQSAAMKMVTGLFSDQGHTWRQAAAANGKGRLLPELPLLSGTRYRPGSGDLPGQDLHGQPDPDGAEKGI